MTAALILMTSACVAGSDCGGCAAPVASCDPCARVGLLDKVAVSPEAVINQQMFVALDKICDSLLCLVPTEPEERRNLGFGHRSQMDES